MLHDGWQALLEQAVEDKAGQHFPLLWRCYLSYELQRGHADAARRVLLRAIHTCPGTKALWLDGFHFLSEQVNTIVLPAFYKLPMSLVVLLGAGCIATAALAMF